MRARDFVYLLQGVLEIGKVKSFDEEQTETIRRHLNMVFKHEIDPSMGDEKHKAELNSIHAQKPAPISGKVPGAEHQIVSPDHKVLARC